MSKENAMFYGKWFSFLFWLMVLGNGMSLVFSMMFFDTASSFYWIGETLSVVVGIMYAQILMKMSAHRSFYHKAGSFLLWASVLSFVAFLFSSSNNFIEYSSLISLVGAVIAYLAQKEEFAAHEHLMLEADVELAERWGALWTWTMRLICVLMVNLLVAFMIPFLSLMISLLAAIAVVVLNIVKIMTLYKSSACMKKIGSQEMTSSSQSDENQL